MLHADPHLRADGVRIHPQERQVRVRGRRGDELDEALLLQAPERLHDVPLQDAHVMIVDRRDALRVEPGRVPEGGIVALAIHLPGGQVPQALERSCVAVAEELVVEHCRRAAA